MKIRVENQKRKQLKNLLKQSLFFSFLLATLITVTNCEKEPDEFGSDMMPGRDSVGVEYDDSFNLSTHLVRMDTFLTSGIESPLIVGNYTDPYFGQNHVSFATQVGISYKNPDFGENPVLDSVKIRLIVDSLYGFKNRDLNLQVYKLNRQLESRDYFSDEDPLDYYSPSDLISVETNNINDSIYDIRLSNEFGNFLLSLDSSEISSDTSFYKVLPGIYCKSESFNHTGQIFTGSAYRMTMRLHYHTETDTSSYTFPYAFGERNIFVSHDFNYGVETIENANKYLTNDPAVNDSMLFIRSLGGTRAKVELPNNIDSLLKNKLIAKATLEFHNIPTYSLLPSESTFSIYKYQPDNSYIKISKEEKLGSNNLYSANITNYIQYLAKGEEEAKEIYITTSNYDIKPANMVIGGVNNQNPMKLKVKYYNNPPE